MQVDSVDEVIKGLELLIEACRQAQNPVGYFAALYLRVTKAIKQGVEDGTFQDPKSIEHLDVVFANRYFKAVDQYQKGQQPTESWQVAFDAARKRKAIVMQHLLLGMNAHINLDLGVALAQASDSDHLTESKADFEKVNDILDSLVVSIRDELADIWIGLKALNWVAGGLEDEILDFSMKEAREQSWKVAEELVKLEGDALQAAINRIDGETAELGGAIVNQSWPVRIIVKAIKVTERGSVSDKIGILLDQG